MHFCKKKQTNPLFEDETRNKITCKRFFNLQTYSRNLRTAFNSDGAIISK